MTFHAYDTRKRIKRNRRPVLLTKSLFLGFEKLHKPVGKDYFYLDDKPIYSTENKYLIGVGERLLNLEVFWMLAKLKPQKLKYIPHKDILIMFISDLMRLEASKFDEILERSYFSQANKTTLTKKVQ